MSKQPPARRVGPTGRGTSPASTAGAPLRRSGLGEREGRAATPLAPAGTAARSRARNELERGPPTPPRTTGPTGWRQPLAAVGGVLTRRARAQPESRGSRRPSRVRRRGTRKERTPRARLEHPTHHGHDDDPRSGPTSATNTAGDEARGADRGAAGATREHRRRAAATGGRRRRSRPSWGSARDAQRPPSPGSPARTREERPRRTADPPAPPPRSGARLPRSKGGTRSGTRDGTWGGTRGGASCGRPRSHDAPELRSGGPRDGRWARRAVPAARGRAGCSSPPRCVDGPGPRCRGGGWSSCIPRRRRA